MKVGSEKIHFSLPCHKKNKGKYLSKSKSMFSVLYNGRRSMPHAAIVTISMVKQLQNTYFIFLVTNSSKERSAAYWETSLLPLLFSLN